MYIHDNIVVTTIPIRFMRDNPSNIRFFCNNSNILLQPSLKNKIKVT